jgi:integral membrane protein
MPTGPRPADVPRVRNVLRVFRVSAIVTGVFLLLLCAMMVLRYGLNVDIELNGPDGFLALQQRKLITGVDLSTAILIVHGWLYVVYLACDFLLWRFVRFSFGRFLYFALGGIIPLLSFYFEFRIPAYITQQLALAQARRAPAEVAA